MWSALRVMVCLLLFSTPSEVFGQDNLQATLSEGAEAANLRRQVADELLVILANADAPREDRLRAAKVLGQLRYAPAIDELIREIDLSTFVVNGRIEQGHPIILALADCGHGAVPPVIDAALVERDGSRRLYYRLAISLGRMEEPASKYFRGIETPPEADKIGVALYERLERLFAD